MGRLGITLLWPFVLPASVFGETIVDRLPKLLSRAEHNLQYVCENATNKLAIVLVKSHRCDNLAVKQCLNVSQVSVDSCNGPLHKTYSLFHIREGRYEAFDGQTYIPSTYRAQLASIWDGERITAGVKTGPGAIVIDTVACKIVSSIFLYDFKISGGRLERAESFNKLVFGVTPFDLRPGLTERVDSAEFNNCAQATAQTSLLGVWEAMNEQEE